MENILPRICEIIIICLYSDSPLLSLRTLIWAALLTVMEASVLLMQVKQEDSKLTVKEIICFALYCLYLVGGLIFSFQVSFFYTFIASFSITSFLIVLCYSPPFVLEKKGSGGIIRILLEGCFWVITHSVALSDSPNFVVFEYLPIFLVYEAWYLIKELNQSADDIKNKFITTAILMGKFGCYRIFILLHAFSWVYLALDMNFAVGKGLPLVLVPWAVYQIKKIKVMDIHVVEQHAFLYYLMFCALSCLGIVFKV